MKKKSLLQIFIRNFIRSLLLIILLAIVGAGSYKVTMILYKDTDNSSKTDEFIKDMVSDVEIDDISENLIYCVDKSTGEITKLVLEVFNTNTHNLDYITIPENTQFTMSNEMYQKICTANPEAPQIIKFSELYKYFEEDNVYEYGIILIEDLLDVDISYYTLMENTVYESVFAEETKTITYTRLETSDETTVGGTENLVTQESAIFDVQILQDDFVSEAATMKKSGELKAFITELYDKIESNLTLKNKLKYLEGYEQIEEKMIYYHGLYGVMSQTDFTVAVEESKQLIKKILNNETYTVAQEKSADNGEAISSVGLNIEVLNGSNIPGLAASYQTMLVDAGYTVTGIGNYSGAVLTETKILVNEEGRGKDLLILFKGAKLEKANLEEGVDIQIILGTADRTRIKGRNAIMGCIGGKES